MMLDQPTLLLIDDHPARAATLAGALRRAEYTVLQTADGPTALLLAAQTAPALILLNMRLPDWRGLELFAGLRAQGSTPIVLYGDGRNGSGAGWNFALGPADHRVQIRCPDDLVSQVRARALDRLVSGNLTLHLAARWVQQAGAHSEPGLPLNSPRERGGC